MKLGSRYSKSELQSGLYLLIFLLYLKCGYLQAKGIECDWSVQRLSCPPYATTDWDCLKTQFNCTNGGEYHCLRDESGEWTETCAKPITCSKGQEPVLKNSQIVCTSCKNPERYEPVDGTDSYKYSECRRIKTSCRRDVSYECLVDETVRHAQNRQCRCDYEKDFMPQNYDLNSDTWICKEPDDLNCIHAPCPEDVYGNAQTRNSDYRCFVNPNRPSTPGPSQRPSDRSSTVVSTEKHATRSSNIDDKEAEAVTPPKFLIILVIVLLVALLGLVIAVVLCKVMKCHLWCGRNKFAMPEGPLEVTKIQYRQMCLSWKPPNILQTETHREPLVIHYVIEQVQGNTRDWIEVTTTKEVSCKVINLKPGTFYNFRVRAKHETGISRPLITQRMYQTKCLTVPEKPQGLTICEITATYITLSWEPPAKDGGTPVTGYVVSYCNISDNKWIKGQGLEDDRTVWKQENLVKDQEYVFQVTANNKVGESEPLESEKPVKLLREPDKPEEFSVIDIMCNAVTLSWNAPKDNGGTGILYYHIRLKQEGSMWENNLTIRSGVFIKTVKKLKPEHSYYFGICAENKVGEGEYCETTEPTKLPKRLGPPDSPLGPLECLNIDYNELILSWKPPQYDGGFPVTQYKVETKENWGLYTPETIVSAITTMFHVKNLNDGTKYRFRVYAVNEKGPSEDALVSEDIVTKPNYPPDVPAGPLEVSDVSDNKITLAWKPPKPYSGSPVTNFIIEIKEDSLRTKLSKWQAIAVSAETTQYEYTGLKEGTAYKFRVKAENTKGISSPVEVGCRTTIVTGPPGAPEGTLEAVDITEDAVTLIWNKPLNDGGSPVIRYRIARKDTWGWSEVFNNNQEETRYRWSNLSKGTKHLFRVEAINKKGSGDAVTKEVVTRKWKDPSLRQSFTRNKTAGDPSSDMQSTSQASEVPKDTDSNNRVSKREERVIAEASQLPAAQTLHKADPPDAPLGPLIVEDVDANTLTLSWRPPEHIGNYPLTGFIIEKMVGRSWIFASEIPPDSTTCHLDKLIEGAKYHFRVSAKNRYGKSDYLTTSEMVETRKLTGPPDAPLGPLIVEDVDANALTLSWRPPKHIGNYPLTGFIIEKLVGRSWIFASEIPPDSTTCHLNKLIEGAKYHFRVSAQTRYGKSDYLTTSEMIETRKLTVPRRPNGPIQYSDITQSSVTLTWKPPDKESSPVSCYKIQYRSNKDLDWNEAGFETTRTSWTQNNLLKDFCYHFRVVSVNSKGESEPLESDREIKPLREPDKPESIMIVAVIDHQVKLNWRPPANNGGTEVQYYHVFLQQDNSNWKSLGRVRSDQTEFVTEILRPGKYMFRICAQNNIGCGDMVESLSPTIIAKEPGVPDIPSGPIEITDVTAESVTLKWSPPEDVGDSPLESYKVYETHDDKDWKRLETLKPSSTFYEAKGLKEGKVYKFSVIAKNKHGKGARLVSETVGPCKEGKNEGSRRRDRANSLTEKSGKEEKGETSTIEEKEKEARSTTL